MADKWNSDPDQDQDESIAGASEERIRGVPRDDDSFEDTPDNLADEDDEEDEEGGPF